MTINCTDIFLIIPAGLPRSLIMPACCAFAEASAKQGWKTEFYLIIVVVPLSWYFLPLKSSALTIQTNV
jgi:hypothetical protein